jgi:large subunit ribosomal protein L13
VVKAPPTQVLAFTDFDPLNPPWVSSAGAGQAHRACRSPAPTILLHEGLHVRTFQPKQVDVQRQWHVIDATDVVLGRFASQAARLLRGKHKPIYAPHVDTGDFVIIVNAAKVALTGAKRDNKIAYRHSGYPGGLKKVPYTDLLGKRPDRAVEKAVKGMLPHTTLGRHMAGKLKVYAGPEHPHQAQRPVPYEITQVSQVSSAHVSGTQVRTPE